MVLRWVSAAVGIPLFIGICLWGQVPFAAGVLALAILGMVEITRAYRAKGFHPNVVLCAAGLLSPAAWLFPAHADVQGALGEAAIALGLMALVIEVLHAATTGELNVARNVAYGLLCGVYVALFGGLSALRSWPGFIHGGYYSGMQTGLGLVVTAACAVWATDSSALFVGRFAGKRKLAPKLSPGKTVEGALAGLGGGLAVGALFGHGLLGSYFLGLLIGAVAGVFGQVGDLFESALKREVGVKDFGAIVPGHGGVLDRFDSLLFVTPLVWLAVWAVQRA